MKRRTFLKGTVTGSAISVAVAAGLLTPQTILAAMWPEQSFKVKDVNEALDTLHGSNSLKSSGDIKIKAPDIAENGAVVPITVSTTLGKISSITLLIEKNPSPLACNFNLGKTTEGFVSTRVKMGKTSDLIAVVKSGGKLYSATKKVKVTIGGCGG